MTPAPIQKRVLSWLIDYIFLFVLLFTSGGIMASILEIESPTAFFLIMGTILFPLKALNHIIEYPRAFGDVNALYFLFAILFCIEVLYFTLSETLFNGYSIGRRVVKTRIVNESGEKQGFFSILLRNCAKVISRYFLCIPLLAILFTPKKQSLYDLATKTLTVLK